MGTQITDESSPPRTARNSASSPVRERKPSGRFRQRGRPVDYKVELQGSEERFRLLVESVQDYAIFLLDPGGHVISWNVGAERIKGYTAAEILGRHLSAFYPGEDVEAGKPGRLLRTAAAEGRVVDEGWRIRKDGSRFWAYVTITALRDREGKLEGFAKVTRDMTERKHYEEKLHKLTGQLLNAQDEERRRLARELHDAIAPNLTGLALNLDMLQEFATAASSEAATLLSRSQALAKNVAEDLRNLSRLLYPPELEVLGLSQALRGHVRGFIERSGIQVELRLPKHRVPMPTILETALFRIAQEALTNVHRHSGSSTAAVQLQIRKNEVLMTIEDHGRGFPAANLYYADATPGPGLGLTSMRERIEELGGKLKIDTGSHGTSITVSAPL
jgi:PAS domain S-box-containing protein